MPMSSLMVVHETCEYISYLHLSLEEDFLHFQSGKLAQKYFSPTYKIQYNCKQSLNNLQRGLDMKSYHKIEWSVEINEFWTRKPYAEWDEPNNEYYQRDDFVECMLLWNSCVCSKRHTTQFIRDQCLSDKRLYYQGYFDFLCKSTKFKNIDSIMNHFASHLHVPSHVKLNQYLYRET